MILHGASSTAQGPDSERHSISDRTVNTGALLIAQIHGYLLGLKSIKTLMAGSLKVFLEGSGVLNLFLHRRPPSWTTLVLYSRAVFIFNEPALIVGLQKI
jgi:hypothetical protein